LVVVVAEPLITPEVVEVRNPGVAVVVGGMPKVQAVPVLPVKVMLVVPVAQAIHTVVAVVALVKLVERTMMQQILAREAMELRVVLQVHQPIMQVVGRVQDIQGKAQLIQLLAV
jgi:hypothetical protein